MLNRILLWLSIFAYSLSSSCLVGSEFSKDVISHILRYQSPDRSETQKLEVPGKILDLIHAEEERLQCGLLDLSVTIDDSVSIIYQYQTTTRYGILESAGILKEVPREFFRLDWVIFDWIVHHIHPASAYVTLIRYLLQAGLPIVIEGATSIVHSLCYPFIDEEGPEEGIVGLLKLVIDEHGGRAALNMIDLGTGMTPLHQLLRSNGTPSKIWHRFALLLSHGADPLLPSDSSCDRFTRLLAARLNIDTSQQTPITMMVKSIAQWWWKYRMASQSDFSPPEGIPLGLLMDSSHTNDFGKKDLFEYALWFGEAHSPEMVRTVLSSNFYNQLKGDLLRSFCITEI